MRLIVDTNVWSLSLRRRNRTNLNADELQLSAQLAEAIQERRVVIIGPIRQEILSGIRDKAVFATTEALLDPFRDEKIIAGDYVEAARLFNVCRTRGVECGSIDILICAVAARIDCGILTSDTGLKRCNELLRAEGRMR